MSRFLAFKESAASKLEVPRSPAASADDDDGDPLLSFDSETAPVSARTGGASDRTPSRRPYVVGAVAVLAVIAVAAVLVYIQRAPGSANPAPAAAVATGTALVDANPPGEVRIDGVLRGTTPVTASLPAGEHVLEVTVGVNQRSLPLLIEAGTTVRQNFEFPAESAVAATGRLEVTSEPAGAQVAVDGAPRGRTPLILASVAAGAHRITISSGEGSIQKTVTVSAGATSSVVASITAAAAAAGWMTIDAPIALNVLEDGEIIGTTSASRLMMAAGTHRLEVANPALEFSAPLTVQISAGRVTKLTVPVPNGSLSVNALPWAAIWIDGREVGTTPLGNLSLPVGSHEIIWRHPQLGERRRTVAVTARSPVRIGMDFSE